MLMTHQIGIPLLVLVLGLVRALSFFEGRVVEGTPRRPGCHAGCVPCRRLSAAVGGAGFLDRIEFWLRWPHLGSRWLYMVLMLPLGIVYFTVAVTLLATSLGLINVADLGLGGQGREAKI